MKKIFLLLAFVLVSCASNKTINKDYMPSLKNGVVKSEIINFVEKSNQNGKLYIPNDEKIALIKLDGVLLPTKPNDAMNDFIFYSIDKLSEREPELSTQMPYKAIRLREPSFCDNFDKNKYYHLYLNTYNNLPLDSFNKITYNYIFPGRKRCVIKYYQAIEEIINYLRINNYQIYLYGDYDRDFANAFCEKLFGVPARNVFARETFMRYDSTSNSLKTSIQSEPYFVKSEDGVSFIYQKLQKKPNIIIAGNSSDYHIMKFTQSNPLGTLIMFVNHNDSQRDYQDSSSIQKLKESAETNGWIEIKVKENYNKVIKD